MYYAVTGMMDAFRLVRDSGSQPPASLVCYDYNTSVMSILYIVEFYYAIINFLVSVFQLNPLLINCISW